MSGAPVIRVNSRAELYDAIALHEQVGAHHRIPLLRALLAGRIAYYEVHRTTSAGTLKRFFGAIEKPAVVLLADDDYAATGPAGFPAADRAMRWARLAVIHGTGGTPAQYAELVETAELVRRVVLVETDSAHIPDWTAAARRSPGRRQVLVLQPIGDGQHPVLPAVRQ